MTRTIQWWPRDDTDKDTHKDKYEDKDKDIQEESLPKYISLRILPSADWHPQSSLPDSCWAQSHRVAAAHVNSCCCCDSIPCLSVSSSDPQLQNNTHPSSPVFASLASRGSSGLRLSEFVQISELFQF